MYSKFSGENIYLKIYGKGYKLAHISGTIKAARTLFPVAKS